MCGARPRPRAWRQVFHRVVTLDKSSDSADSLASLVHHDRIPLCHAPDTPPRCRVQTGDQRTLAPIVTSPSPTRTVCLLRHPARRRIWTSASSPPSPFPRSGCSRFWPSCWGLLLRVPASAPIRPRSSKRWGRRTTRRRRSLCGQHVSGLPVLVGETLVHLSRRSSPAAATGRRRFERRLRRRTVRVFVAHTPQKPGATTMSWSSPGHAAETRSAGPFRKRIRPPCSCRA